MHCGVQEGSPDLGIIITGKRRTGNAVDDIFEILVQIVSRALQCHHFQPVTKRIHARNIIGVIKHQIDRSNVPVFHLPDLHRTGMEQFAGISDIKHIAHLHTIAIGI